LSFELAAHATTLPLPQVRSGMGWRVELSTIDLEAFVYELPDPGADVESLERSMVMIRRRARTPGSAYAHQGYHELEHWSRARVHLPRLPAPGRV
jgi:hypothetical protein